MKRFFLLVLFVVAFPIVSFSNDRRPSYNEVALDFPTEGGMMLMASRMWIFGDHVRAGLALGGGRIDNDLDFSGTLEATTESVVVPYFGPRVTLFWEFIGLSFSYGAFYMKSDYEFRGGGLNAPLSGDESGWGTGIYSPLLVMDFYNKKHDFIFGVGLGGFFGLDTPKLEARSNNVLISTDESPVDTLTFHIRTQWSTDRKKRIKAREEFEEEW